MMDSIDFTPFLQQYSFKQPWWVAQGESGMNNTTRMVEAGKERFVLRIYNNHKDTEVVKLEHELLQLLQKKALPFRVPRPVSNSAGETVTVSEDGTVASLFDYIEGERTDAGKRSHVSELGKAAGALTAALGEVKPIGKPLYSPYYLLEETYAAMDSGTFSSLSERSDALRARRDAVRGLLNVKAELVGPAKRIAELPRQWIHGDLVFNNTVMLNDAISGVLDFEFCTVDARAMELAVTAVDMIKPETDDTLDKMLALFAGYSDLVRLTRSEIELLPAMMKLRLLDVALHFAVRFVEGLDKEEVLCGIVDQSAYGCSWVDKHASELLAQLL